MAEDRLDDPNDTGTEATGGTDTGITAKNRTRGRGRVADTVDRLGESLERNALEMELKGGIRAKTAPAIRRASRAADVSAAYVRENSVGEMRMDLESEIREHPLKSIAIALGCGYLLAKMLD